MSRGYIFHLLKLLLSLAVLAKTTAAKQPCYFMKILDMRITETPDYRFDMVKHSNQTLSSVTRVLKEIAVPLWHFQIVQHSSDADAAKGIKSRDKHGVTANFPLMIAQGSKILYNATYKTCDFWKYAKRIRVFNNVAQMVLSRDGGNLSLDCPLAVGTYVLRNIHVPPDTGLLKFMYWPNTTYTLYGTVYAALNDKSWEKKCSYAINGTVLKTC